MPPNSTPTNQPTVKVEQKNARLVASRGLRASFENEVLCWGEIRVDENGCQWVGDGSTPGGVRQKGLTREEICLQTGERFPEADANILYCDNGVMHKTPFTNFCASIPVGLPDRDSNIVFCENGQMLKNNVSVFLSNACYTLPTIDDNVCELRKVAFAFDEAGCGRLYTYTDADAALGSSNHNQHPDPLFTPNSGTYIWPRDLPGGSNPYTSDDIIAAILADNVDPSRLRLNSLIDDTFAINCATCITVPFSATIRRLSNDYATIRFFRRFTYPDGTVEWGNVNGNPTSFAAASNYQPEVREDFRVCTGMGGNVRVEIFAFINEGDAGDIGVLMDMENGNFGWPAASFNQST